MIDVNVSYTFEAISVLPSLLSNGISWISVAKQCVDSKRTGSSGSLMQPIKRNIDSKLI